jgi:hypothetical protein
MLHNLRAEQHEYIQRRLLEEALLPLTIHPLFITVLILELLFNEALEKLDSAFDNSIRLSTAGGLKAGPDAELFKHLQQANIDIKVTAALALTDEQELLGVQEKIEFAMKMGNKIITWLDDLDSTPCLKRKEINSIQLERLFKIGYNIRSMAWIFKY